MQVSQTVSVGDSTGETVPPSNRLRNLFRPLTVLVMVSMLTLILFDRPLIRGDGIAYLAWIDTLVRDHGINFNNEFDRLRAVNTYQISWDATTQKWVDIFPFGIAFFQIPFYLLGLLTNHVAVLNQNPDYFLQMQGIELPYSLWMMFGANLMALASIILSWHIGQRFCGKWMAALITWAFFLGTPLFYYSTISPLNSHNPGAFMCALFVWLLMERTQAFGFGATKALENPDQVANQTDRMDGLKWTLLGISAGLMALTRWQLLLIAVPVWGLLTWERRWRGLAIATVAAALTLLPLPLIWQNLFGSPFLVPYQGATGQAFLFLNNHFLDVLVILLHFSPILLISVAGVPFLWRIDRKWAIVAIAMIILELLINGAVRDWWAGDSFGMRRMSELYVIYVMLACVALGDPVRRLGLSLGARTAQIWKTSRIFLSGALGVLIVYSFLFIFSFLSFTWTNPDGVFIAEPETMISFFMHQDTRWDVINTIFHTHVGPLAWPQPGP